MPDIVVMFFLLGLVAGLLRSDLTIPKAAYDTLSLLLMLSIGLKGGLALHDNLEWKLLLELAGVATIGVIIPLLIFPILRFVCRAEIANSASLVAHYGSVSAGTFAVVIAYASSNNIPLNAETTLYLVTLELPAIIVGLLLYRMFSQEKVASRQIELWHETLTNRGVVLLLGGVIIGYMYGPNSGADVTSLFTSMFKAVLALFLLEMGLTAAETLKPIPWEKWRLLLFAAIAPFGLSFVGIGIGLALGVPEGSVLVLASLAASASYIAAPAAIKTAIPKADIGLAMLMSLGITFPINVLVGIPIYHAVIQQLS